MLILGIKIGTFLSFKSEERISARGDHFEIMINYLYHRQFSQYSLPYLQTMPFLSMYYTMFHFQLNQKKVPFVFFWSIKLDLVISEKSKLSLEWICNLLLFFSWSIFSTKQRRYYVVPLLQLYLFLEKFFKLSFFSDPSLSSSRESSLIFFLCFP